MRNILRKRRLVYNAVKDAAINGQPVPRVKELSKVAGYTHDDGAHKPLRDLVREGVLEIEGSGLRRIMRIPALNIQTASRYVEPEQKPYLVRIACFVDHAADVFDTTAKDITGTSRFREHVRARRAVALAASLHGWGVTAIGRALKRDHSTVRYHCAEARKSMQSDPAWSGLMGQLVERIAA